MRIKIYISTIFMFYNVLAYAQVKFGENPTITNPKAVLDIESTTKGLLLPRMSTLQRLAITSPPAGLQVYDNTSNSLWYFNGTAWVAAVSDNIYTTDGTLLANRTVAQAANTLSFTSTASTGTSHFTVDGTTLNVDAVNNRLGVGTATPAVSLDARGSIHVDDASTAATANQQGGYLTWNRANVGGVGSPNGGHLGFLNHQGTGSGGFVFTTTNDNTTFNERMRITGAGLVGLNTTSPEAGIDMLNNGTDNRKDDIIIRNFSTDGSNATLSFVRSRGTVASPQPVQATDILGRVLFGGRWNSALNFDGSVIQSTYRGNGTTTSTDLQFLTSNAARMIINENGNVGIGTTAPNAALQFANVVSNRRLVLWESANNDHQFYGLGTDLIGLRYQIANTAGSHAFFAGTGTGSSNELMRITGNGNVGIGTTAPNAPLQFANTNANRKIVLWESANNNHQFYGFGIDAGGLRYQIDNTAFNHSFFAGTGTGSSNELMRITGTGNVGIGTTAPNAALQFANVLSNRRLVLWEGANNNHQFFGFGINSGTLRYQVDNTGANHSFFAATGAGTSNELMRITGSGLVGIGTTNPGNRLEVASGNTGTSGLRFTNMNNSSAVSSGSTVGTLGINSNGDVVVASNTTADILARGRFTFGDVGGGAISGISVSGNLNISSVNKLDANRVQVNFSSAVPTTAFVSVQLRNNAVAVSPYIESQSLFNVVITLHEWAGILQNIEMDLMVLR